MTKNCYYSHYISLPDMKCYRKRKRNRTAASERGSAVVAATRRPFLHLL